jgi:hypothetical protein
MGVCGQGFVLNDRPANLLSEFSVRLVFFLLICRGLRLVFIPLIGLCVVGSWRWCGRFLRIGQHACSGQQAGKQANLNSPNKMSHDYPLTFWAADNVSAHPIRLHPGLAHEYDCYQEGQNDSSSRVFLRFKPSKTLEE